MGIIAVSDVHLGYFNPEDKNESLSNKDDFKKFLEMVANMDGIDNFVICGDLLDMWRRDIVGVVIENMDVLQQLQELKSKMKVHYIVGNHDYHLIKLKNQGNPFTFYEEEIHRVGRNYLKPLSIQDGGKTYRFTHGYEFEPIMWASRGAFDILCYSNDEVGDIGSWAWKILGKLGISIEKDILNKVLLPARKRIDIEEVVGSVREARDKIINKGEILIFGHTHKPYINKERTVVNLGSWVKDSDVHNTYVEIKNGTIELKKFH